MSGETMDGEGVASVSAPPELATGWVESGAVMSDKLSSGDNQMLTNNSVQFGLNYGYDQSQPNYQTNNENICEKSANQGVNAPSIDSYNQYYQNYYANYYQNYQSSSGYADNAEGYTQAIDTVKSKSGSAMDLINKALAKHRSHDTKSFTDGNRDDDEEEGQIASSPGVLAKKAKNDTHSHSPAVEYSGDSSKSRSRSRSKGTPVRSPSRSRSRKRYISRSRSRSRSRRRRRSRSRSRSPYFGPIIKDYRRGRRGFVRYPRGFRDRGVRPFRGGQQYGYGNSRRRDFSRSRSRSISRSKSRSVSPKRKQIVTEKREETTSEEKTVDSKTSETLKPSDIKSNEKRLTQTFLAMLEEKQSRSKMIPFETTRSESNDEDADRHHGFVNTFNDIREMEAKKHTLSYDLEREGWQVIDDATSESTQKKRSSREHHKHSDKKESVEHEKAVKVKPELNSSDNENSSKKKKSKKRKKRRRRSTSTSSESSVSESDNVNEEYVGLNDKKSKKKKKNKKKKKKVMSSSSSSEDESKLKKMSKSKRVDTSKDSSDEKSKVEASLAPIPKSTHETPICDEKTVLTETDGTDRDLMKTKEKKKKKKKSKDYESSDSELDKKKKKKRRKKSSKKRKRRSSSSSSSSDSSDSSDSDGRKKKKKKHKKRSKKHKKDKKLIDSKEKTKVVNEDKKKSKEEEIEFVTVLSAGETPIELKWPKNLIKFTQCEPNIEFSINPKVTVNSEDFKQTKDNRNRINEEIERIRHFGINDESGVKNEKLSTEYDKFMDELNPNAESHGTNEESQELETKMRDKLVKHLSDKKDDSMTSSERRAIEKMKKKGIHSHDGSVDNRNHDDMKSAPMSAYYSSKVQKSSPVHRSSDLDRYEPKNSKSNETDIYHKTNEICLNMTDQRSHSSHKSDKSHSKVKTTDDKKKTTAQDLLERVKQKKDSNKESKEGDKDNSQKSKRLSQMAKIPHKKSVIKTKSSVTTANADSTQQPFISKPMKLDMNFDYNWYLNYYWNSAYGVGQYPQVNDPSLASAYYAQYAMTTSNDYNLNDMNAWMAQNGYALDSSNVWSQNQNDIKTDEIPNESYNLLPNVESPLETNATLNSEKISESDEQIVDKIVTNSETIDGKIKNEMDNESIGVIISTTNVDTPFNSDVFDEPKSEMDESFADIHTQDGDSPPPPPPPPPRPLMTTMTASEPITLPNGQVLPVGTKQIVVHPYQTDDPNKFTADWYYDAFNAHNGSQTNTS